MKKLINEKKIRWDLYIFLMGQMQADHVCNNNNNNTKVNCLLECASINGPIRFYMFLLVQINYPYMG